VGIIRTMAIDLSKDELSCIKSSLVEKRRRFVSAIVDAHPGTNFHRALMDGLKVIDNLLDKIANETSNNPKAEMNMRASLIETKK
jgi:hypothetical protein